MNNQVGIIIRPDGSVEGLQGPVLRSLQQTLRARAQTRRASHIIPANRLLAALFRAVRTVFGESGRVAEWTRGWTCRWTVDLSPSGGPHLGPYASRDTAIAAEIGWLLVNWR